MQSLIFILGVVLVGVAGLAIKFILEEDKDKKKKQTDSIELISALEEKLKLTQEELSREKTEKQESENLLYKVKDELDNLKNFNNELNQQIKELAKTKEVLKQEISEKEKIRVELDAIKKDRDSQQRQLAVAKSEIEPLRKENEELKNKLKLVEEIHDGLKGQYDELSKQLEEINKMRIDEGLSKDKQKVESIQAKPQTVDDQRQLKTATEAEDESKDDDKLKAEKSEEKIESKTQLNVILGVSGVEEPNHQKITEPNKEQKKPEEKSDK
jgi:chromosome segregation ATPase